MHVTGRASEVDFLAFSITMLLTLVCAFGAKESSLVNNFLTGTNGEGIAYLGSSFVTT